jgi:hypothetical protein
MGGFVVMIPVSLILYIIYIAPWSLSLSPSTPHLGQLQEVFYFCFIQVYEVHEPHTVTLIYFLHPPPPISSHPPTHIHTGYAYFIVLVFIIGISKGCPNVCPPWVCFTLVCSTYSIALSLTLLPPTSHFSTAFNKYPYILYLYSRYVLQYCWCFITLFLPLPPQVP